MIPGAKGELVQQQWQNEVNTVILFFVLFFFFELKAYRWAP